MDDGYRDSKNSTSSDSQSSHANSASYVNDMVGGAADNLPDAALKSGMEEFLQKCNYYSLSDTSVEHQLEDFITRESHVEQISNRELQMMYSFLRDYEQNNGIIDVRKYLIPQRQPENSEGGKRKQHQEQFTIPQPLKAVFVAIIGWAGTGKTYSMATYLTKNYCTFSGATNKCTANMFSKADDNVMPGSFGSGASTKTVFQLNKIRYSRDDIRKIYNVRVLQDPILVRQCNSMYDVNGEFMKNAIDFDQEKVNELWCKHLNIMLKGIYPIYTECKREFEKEFEKVHSYARLRYSGSTHKFYQPVSMQFPCVRQIKNQEKYAHLHADVFNNINDQDAYKRHLISQYEDPRYPLVSTQLMFSEFLVDEAGLCKEVMWLLTVLLWYYANFLYNTPQLHTRRPVFILNGSLTQGKAIGFPTSMLALFNGVSVKCKGFMSVVSVFNRRRVTGRRDLVTEMHKLICMHPEQHIQFDEIAYWALKFQEIGANKVKDSHYKPNALRVCQKHTDCTEINEGAYIDGKATLKFIDNIYASSRLVYLDHEDRDIKYPKSNECLDVYPMGLVATQLSKLSAEEANRNLVLAFIGFYRENHEVCPMTAFGPEVWYPDKLTAAETIVYDNMTMDTAGLSQIMSTATGQFSECIEHKITDSFGQHIHINKNRKARMRHSRSILRAKREKKARERSGYSENDGSESDAGDDEDEEDDDDDDDAAENITDSSASQKKHTKKRQGCDNYMSDTRSLPYIMGPAEMFLDANTHRRMRNNARALQHNLRSDKLFDSSQAKNEKDNWEYTPKLDMVRIIGWPTKDLQHIIKQKHEEYTRVSTMGSSKIDVEQLTHDVIEAYGNGIPICDVQMYMAFQRIRYLVPNSIVASTLQTTSTSLKGVQTSLEHVMSDREINTLTTESFRLCLYVGYIEEAFRWRMQEACKPTKVTTNTHDIDTHNLHNKRRKKINDVKSDGATTTTTTLSSCTTSTSSAPIKFVDFDSIKFRDMFSNEEYKSIRERISPRAMHFFSKYDTLVSESVDDVAYMSEMRRREKAGCKTTTVPKQQQQHTKPAATNLNNTFHAFGDCEDVDKRQMPSSSDATTHTAPENIADTTAPPIENHQEQRRQKMGAYPSTAVANKYFQALQKIVQFLMADKREFQQFTSKIFTIYVDGNEPFYKLFKHHIRTDTYTVSSTMPLGSLMLLGNYNHAACKKDIENDEHYRVTCADYLNLQVQWLENSCKNNTKAYTTGDKTSFRYMPNSIQGIMNQGLKRWFPEVHHSSIVTYLINDALIGITMPNCDGKARWEDIFSAGVGEDGTKQSIVDFGNTSNFQINHKKQKQQQHLFGYMTRQAQPNNTCSKNNTFAQLHSVPYGGGLNFPVDFDAFSASCNTNIICKTPTDIFPLAKRHLDQQSNTDQRRSTIATAVEDFICLKDERKKQDMITKRVDMDALYTVKTDASPANVTTLAPTQGQTFKCKLAVNYDQIDTDGNLLLLTRLDNSSNYLIANVRDAEARLLMPESVKPVGGASDPARVEELRNFNNPRSLRQKRIMIKARDEHVILRP